MSWLTAGACDPCTFASLGWGSKICTKSRLQTHLLDTLKSNLWDQPATTASILLRAASCPTKPPTEHPAILTSKDHQLIVPNSAVLTLSDNYKQLRERLTERKKLENGRLKRTSKQFNQFTVNGRVPSKIPEN